MNDMIKREGAEYIADAIKTADIKISLEQWPCAVAVLGVCATCAFVAWINKPAEEQDRAA